MKIIQVLFVHSLLEYTLNEELYKWCTAKNISVVNNAHLKNSLDEYIYS
jgi:hypothetical protein